MLEGKILVTGGTGTLGTAIIRTAQREGWNAEFTVYSRSELRQAQMKAKFPGVRMVLGDVRDYDRLAASIAGHDLVIHAAALKRIPECETHPTECFATNVFGSQNVVRACILHGIKRCIGISTDKACKSITCYGASKLAMEKLFQAQPAGPCIFTLVRYGNVVASNGSVIPLWRDQAARGEPLAVTNPDMTRFWMAPSEAVRLVCSAATLAAGQILVPAMGALSLLQMAAIIAPEAKTTTIGLRSCEKVHEELFHADESVCTAMDDNDYLIVAEDHPYGTKGGCYPSNKASWIAPDAFLAMLEEAESYA